MTKTALYTSSREKVSSLVVFYVLAFAISWAIWSPLILSPQESAPGFLLIVGAYGPFLAALVTTGLYEGLGGARRWLKGIFNWRTNLLWYLTGALLLPLLAALLHLGLYLVLGGEAALSSDPPWFWALASFPLGILIAAPLGSGVEEAGWQGFALPRLLRRHPPSFAAGIHGILWAAWHLPLYFSAAWSGKEPLHWMFAYTIPLAMILVWLTQKSKGSVIPAILLHTATNYYGSLYIEDQIFVSSMADNFSAIKTVVYWSIAIGLLLVTRGRLGYHEEKES